MRSLLIWITAAWTSLAGVGLAQVQDNPVVVELFTSQGCSSCPPADELLAELAGRDDIIPLALHVDYWDYIGWEDKFARHAFTKRQKGYAYASGRKRIYTPQIIVNGAEDVVGSHPMKVMKLIEKHSGTPEKVRMSLSRSGAELTIRAEALADMAPCDVQVVQYQPSRLVQIHRGENAGRAITYTHIVRTLDVIGRWTGGGVYKGRATIDPGLPVVVLVQEPDYGRIVAASRLR